jgi:hypothetical protein
LTVADDGDRLAMCFGPLPLFKRRIRYDDIREIEIGRTTIVDGWPPFAAVSVAADWQCRKRSFFGAFHATGCWDSRFT